MRTTGRAGGAGDRFVVTEAERQVADLLSIEVEPAVARAIVGSVPFWFHTFALNRGEGIYTPGAARDHRYRLPLLPADLAGLRVLDVGTFDGFYAFLAEHRGASRVLAVDNEQYRQWVAARWGIDLEGGAGFCAIHRLLGSALSTGAPTRSRWLIWQSALMWCSASGSCTGSRIRSGSCGRCEARPRQVGRCWSRPTACRRRPGMVPRSGSPSRVRCTRATSLSTGVSARPALIGWRGSPASRGRGA